MGMTSRQAAIRAKGKTSKRLGTVRSKADEPKAHTRRIQSKVDVSPFTDGALGLGVLSVPPKPVKR